MKFKIKKEELLKGLRRIQGVVGRTNTMPILSNMLIIADKEGLEMTATDLEIGLKGRYQAEVETPGSIVVPAKKLYEVARELPAEEVRISVTDDNRLTVTAGSAKFRLLGLPKDEYPEVPDMKERATVPVESGLLKEMIDKTIYASGENDARYVLNGLYIHLSSAGDGLAVRMVATDGHRLSLIGRMVNSKHDEVKVIVPKRAMSEMQRLLEEDETGAEVRLGFTPSHILFKRNGLVMQSKLIDGNYPNYSQVIPQGLSKTVTVSRSALIGVLKRVSLISNEKTRLVKLALEKGKATFSTSSPEQGEAVEEMAIAYEGEPIVTGYNARYLLDVLTAMEKDKVVIGFNDSLSPCMITEEGDVNHKGIVMPMRV